MGAVGWKTRVSLEKMKTFCIKSAGVNLDCMLRADTIKYKWLCTFIRAGTLSALMRLRKLTFSCSKIKGILKAPRPYRLLLSTKKKTFISRVSKRKHINVDGFDFLYKMRYIAWVVRYWRSLTSPNMVAKILKLG